MQQTKVITVIPPDPKYDSHIRIEQKQLNVAANCRVSTRFEQCSKEIQLVISFKWTNCLWRMPKRIPQSNLVE